MPETIKSNNYLMKFVADRACHYIRCAIDVSSIAIQLNWMRQESFGSYIRKIVQLYLNNPVW